VVPSPGELLKCLVADEAVYRPTYSGTGIITLESSLGGYHILDLRKETWILDRGAYWASEGAVQVGFRREPILTSFWAGEGLVYLETQVRGEGKVVITTRGPVNEIELRKGSRFVAEGNCVIARTGDVSFRVRRPTTNWLGRFTSGEGWLRVFEGPGRLLLNPAPYWRYRVFNDARRSDSLIRRAIS
jgi:uncharacterized protein (AIM24 family)